MSTLFLILAIVALAGALLGLINPKLIGQADWGRFKAFITCIGLFLVFFFLFAFNMDVGTTTTSTVAPPTSQRASVNSAPATPKRPVVTMAGYNAVKTGMTYDQVVAILGPPAEELSRSEMGGYVTVMYAWHAGNAAFTGANMNVMFQNGEVINKAQAGLK